MRYMLTIEYDGSKFHGFQRQKNYESVQAKLEETLEEILKTPVQIKGAGRTDAGVHAYGQVCHFDSIQLVPENNLMRILNKKLQPYIYVKEVKYVDETFHARINAVKKEYRYYINIGEYDPTKADYMYFYNRPLDIENIKLAMEYVKGTHDFKSFSKNKEIENTIRTIELFDLNINNNILEFRIIGTGFMYNMVRIIMAILIKIGEHKFEPIHMKEIIEGTNRKYAPWVAPSCGLYLWKVYY